MAELIKNPRRLKPVVGFGADLPRKARKRGVNKSLRRDKNIAKARRAEAKELKLQGRTLRLRKEAADTQSAIRAKADRETRRQLWEEAEKEKEGKSFLKEIRQLNADLRAILLADKKAKEEKEVKSFLKEIRQLNADLKGILLASTLITKKEKEVKSFLKEIRQLNANLKGILLASTLITKKEMAKRPQHKLPKPVAERVQQNRKLAREFSLAKSRLEAATLVAIARPSKVVSGTGRK